MLKTGATRFIFRNYEVKGLTIIFYYRVEFENHGFEEFHESVDFSQIKISGNVSDEIFQKISLGLHLLLGINYFKLYLPSQITIDSGQITREEAEIWNVIYTKSLGEFYYKNQINFHHFIQFPYKKISSSVFKLDPIEENKALVPIGGGKDSIVTAMMLKEKKTPLMGFTVNRHPIQDRIIKELGIDSINITRTIDPKMVALSEAGKVYAGHVPATAFYSLLATMAGYLTGARTIIMSSERSANYGNVNYLGEPINHQWSKSKEFEDLFRTYLKKFVSPSLEYFSLLRPYFEIEIVRRFCQYPEFFSLFSSCNRNFKLENALKNRLWCGGCEKCAFIFCLLSAFIQKASLLAIFGKDLYSDKYLLDTYRELLGIKNFKPFQCVGTPEEVKVAFYMASQLRQYNDEVAMNMFNLEAKPKLADVRLFKKRVFSSYGSHNISPVYLNEN